VTPSLLTIFPKPADLLALKPEDFGGAIMEIAPIVSHRNGGKFRIDDLPNPLFGDNQLAGSHGFYPRHAKNEVPLVLALRGEQSTSGWNLDASN
jgi:hypothetical protein